MKKWVLKALIQKIISFLPYKHKINYLFQKYVTKGVQLSAYYFEDRLEHLDHHLSFLKKYKNTLEEKTALELGTGWYPVIPIGLFLSGAKQIYTVDISQLMDKEKVLITIERYLSYEVENRFTRFDFLPSRFKVLRQLLEEGNQINFHSLLEKMCITYLVEDAQKLPLPNDSLDLITSNNTFEHVYPKVLSGILKEFDRILKQDGLMSHFVDMSDHFAHLDKSITIYNFLQFTEHQWQLIDNSIQPQNRWRVSHFRSLYQQLDIPWTEEINRPGDQEALNSIKISDDFKDISKEDLAVSHTYIVSSY